MVVFLCFLALCPCVFSFISQRSISSRIAINAKTSICSSASAVFPDVHKPSDWDPISAVKTLDELIPRKEIAELAKAKSDIEGLKQVSFQFGLVSLFSVLFKLSTRNSFIISLGTLGMLSYPTSFYFAGLHETVHRTAFRSRSLNDIFSQVFGFLTLRPAVNYRHYHWQHHRHTGDPALDSELQPSLIDFPVKGLATYLLYLSGMPFWGDAISTILKHAFGNANEPYLTTKRAMNGVIIEARVYVMLYSLVYLGCLKSGAFAAAIYNFWVLPSLVGQCMLRFYLMAEHTGCQKSQNTLENTRTSLTNPFYRLLAWQVLVMILLFVTVLI
jgi:fatty acid desaturase